MAKGGSTLRSNSYGIEGVNAISEMDFIQFGAGMDTYHETYQLPLAFASDVTNFRPIRPGLEKRKGQLKLHSTADSTNQVVNLLQFSKGKQTQVKTYAQMSDGDVLLLTNNPPTVTSGVMGSSVYNTTDTTNMLPASHAIINDRLMYCDGTDYPFIYSGTTESVSSFVVYKGAETIPDIPLKGEDYTLEVGYDDNDLYAILDSLSTLAAYDCIFIRTDTPANAFNWTIKTTNVTGAVFQLHYWNDAWTAVSGFVDNTSAGGITLGINGSMTWTNTTDHKQKYMFGENGYWYRLSLSSGALDSEVEVYRVTYDSWWVEMQNIWDGIRVPAIEAYVYKNTYSTMESYNHLVITPSSTNPYTATAIDISGLTSSDKIYFNSMVPILGFYADVGDVPNETASTTMTVKYYTGSAFASLSINDGTMKTTSSLSQNGWVTWVRPTDEHPTMYGTSDYYSYWYEITTDKTLTADMVLNIETMPYYDMKPFGKCHSLCSWKGRISYGFDRVPGYVVISAGINPMSISSDSDATFIEIGDGRSNKVACQKRFYNELLVWQVEKGTEGGCLTLIEGYSVETFGKRVISTEFGTFSAKSATVVEDVPFGEQLSTDESGGLKSKPTRTTVAYFLSNKGVCMCDGKNINVISRQIQNYFDTKDSTCIRRGYETKHWLAYDSVYQVLRIGLVSGSSATVPNIFLVYDTQTGQWYHDSIGQALSSHIEVETDTGQYPIMQIGGGTADGTVHLLNYGTTDNGTTITCSATLEFDGRGHDLHIEEILLRSSGSCTVTPYHDGTANSDITISA